MKIREIPMLTALFLALMIFGGCVDQNELNKMKKEVEEMKIQVKVLDKMSENYFNRISEIEDLHKTIYLDPTSKNYQKLDADGYIFLIKCDDIKPYAGGYKLTMFIGNPYLISFNGFKLSIEWGKDFDSKKDDYSEWQKSLRIKIETFTSTLIPGRWNKVEFMFSPAKEDDIRHLKIFSMETNTMQFPPPLLYYSPR